MSAWERDAREIIADWHPRGETPMLRDVVASEMAGLIRGYIVSGWPVATGLSVAGWRTRGTVVYNDVEYVPFVRNGLADRLWEEALDVYRAQARARLTALTSSAPDPANPTGGLRLARRSAGGARVGVSVRDSQTGAMPPQRTAPPPRTNPPAPSSLTAPPRASTPVATPRQVQAALAALAPYSVPADVLAYVQQGRVEDALRVLTRSGNTRAATALRAAVRR